MMRRNLRAALVDLAPVLSFFILTAVMSGVLWSIGTENSAHASSALTWSARVRTDFGARKLAPVARTVSRCMKMDPSGRMVFGLCAVEVPLLSTALPTAPPTAMPIGEPARAPATQAAPATRKGPRFPAQLRPLN